ncbi:MAG: outer membrane lipoprotein-sorting protein [Deltaproteobacteria bacterium]|nr:outer membrane lipoprotein-sorting protein [Deltaproteobacteria bacterium]
MGKHFLNGIALVAAVLLALAPAPALGAADDAGALVRKATDALPKNTFTAQLKLTPQSQPGRDLRLEHKVVGGARASYLEVTAPEALSGIRFLFLEHPTGQPEQYIKVAAARNAVQVKDQVRKQPFLESDFYVSDLVEPQVDAYDYKFVGDEELLGRKTKLVEAVPKNSAGEIYGKTVIAIDPEDALILKRSFYDLKGNLLKVWTIDQVEKVDGVWTFRKQTMTTVPAKTSSTLETPEVKYDVELTDSVFTPEHLRR